MRILLVEDEIRLARSYARNLEDGGHSVTALHDGDAAYDTVTASPDAFDALIVDVLLPGRNGIALCRDVRRAGVKTPILLLTALDTTQDKVAGLDAGADDYLTKPFPFEELLARLRPRARQIAHSLGGEMTVTSELGIGSTFTVRLPYSAGGDS